MAVSPDGHWLAYAPLADQKVVLYDLVDRRATAILTGHRAAVECLAFSSDSSRLATGGLDSCVKLWRVDKGGYEVATLCGADQEVAALACSPDCLALTAAAAGGRLLTWPVTRGQDFAL